MVVRVSACIYRADTADAFRTYVRQLREETALRLVEVAYNEDGELSRVYAFGLTQHRNTKQVVDSVLQEEVHEYHPHVNVADVQRSLSRANQTLFAYIFSFIYNIVELQQLCLINLLQNGVKQLLRLQLLRTFQADTLNCVRRVPFSYSIPTESVGCRFYDNVPKFVWPECLQRDHRVCYKLERIGMIIGVPEQNLILEQKLTRRRHCLYTSRKLGISDNTVQYIPRWQFSWSGSPK